MTPAEQPPNPGPGAPADLGLQPERTALAWRRTSLSVAVGSLVGLRVLPPQLGLVGYLACAIGLLWSLDLAATASRRHDEADARLRGRAARADRGGRVGPSVTRAAGATVIVGATALLCIALIASS